MTSNPKTEAETPDSPGRSLFDRVLVGVDGSEQGHEAQSPSPRRDLR
jgi:hypothetical protein